MKGTITIVGSIVLFCLLAVGYDIYATPQLTRVTPSHVSSSSSLDPVGLGPVPDFSFETLEGQTLSIHDLKGKPVIINFWATWCTPCLTEFPHLLTLIKHYDGKIILLAISSDKNIKDIHRFLNTQPPEIQEILRTHPIYITLDKKRAITHDLFLTERYPESIILAPNGTMRRKIVGLFDWQSTEIKKYLTALSKAPL